MQTVKKNDHREWSHTRLLSVILNIRFAIDNKIALQRGKNRSATFRSDTERKDEDRGGDFRIWILRQMGAWGMGKKTAPTLDAAFLHKTKIWCDDGNKLSVLLQKIYIYLKIFIETFNFMVSASA